MKTVADVLDKLTIENLDLAESLPDNAVRCNACAHRCLIREGKRGICQVRFNQEGKLYVPWGYVAGLQADPIEKKPAAGAPSAIPTLAAIELAHIRRVLEICGGTRAALAAAQMIDNRQRGEAAAMAPGRSHAASARRTKRRSGR